MVLTCPEWSWAVLKGPEWSWVGVLRGPERSLAVLKGSEWVLRGLEGPLGVLRCPEATSAVLRGSEWSWTVPSMAKCIKSRQSHMQVYIVKVLSVLPRPVGKTDSFLPLVLSRSHTKNVQGWKLMPNLKLSFNFALKSAFDSAQNHCFHWQKFWFCMKKTVKSCLCCFALFPRTD